MTLVDLRFEITSFIRRYPCLFFPLMRANKRLRAIRGTPLVTRRTELVIEGFFRSANTFASLSFVAAQPRTTAIANHTHAPASVIRAVRWGIPVVLLVREPVDTALSLALKSPGLSLARCLQGYIGYHSRLLPYREDVVVARFEEVVSDLGAVIERVNRRWGTCFKLPQHTEGNIEAVFSRIEGIDREQSGEEYGRYSIPLRRKEAAKQELRTKLDQPRLRTLVQEAERVFREFVAASARP